MLRIVKLTNELRIAKEKRKKLTEAAASFSVHEKQLETALNELREDTPQEDVDAVNAEMEAYENEKGEHDKDVADLDAKIEGIEKEIGELQDNAPDGTPSTDPTPAGERKQTMNLEVREHMPIRRTRNNPFGQSRTEREAYLGRPEVKEFYERVLELARSKRAVNNSELGIPEVMMGFIRDSIDDYSALLSAIDMRSIRGDGKAVIAGEIPEAVWTECCANINQLSIDFSAMYVYCHKVAGYIPVCNATLEDFGGWGGIPMLAAEIEFNLLKAIAYSLNKAIIYGDGVHMPLGFVRSLTMTANPINPSETWTDLSATNVQSISGPPSVEGKELFQAIMRAVGAAKRRTATRGLTWLMNETTWNTSIAPESLAINAAGTMVAASNSTFPILGGNIIFLDFIPDGDIIGGYLDNYLLVERKGIQFAGSEHVFFLEDNTVFKATARYDGTPIPPFRDSFFAINVKGGTPATTATFAPDTANPGTP